MPWDHSNDEPPWTYERRMPALNGQEEPLEVVVRGTGIALRGSAAA